MVSNIFRHDHTTAVTFYSSLLLPAAMAPTMHVTDGSSQLWLISIYTLMAPYFPLSFDWRLANTRSACRHATELLTSDLPNCYLRKELAFLNISITKFFSIII